MAQQVRTTPRPQQRPKAAQQPQPRQRSARSKSTSVARPFNLPFESKNIMFILIGMGIVTLGYIIMATSDVMGVMAVDISPIVLLIGYVVVIPLGIMLGAHKKNAQAAMEETPIAQA